MPKTLTLKLPVINLKNPFKLDKSIIMIPEEKYKQLLEDIEDLRDALKAEEEYLEKGGGIFIDYDKKRRKRSR